MTEGRRNQIQELADNLHIPLYIREDGNAYQFPPGERIDPRYPWPTPFYGTDQPTTTVEPE